MAEEFELYTPKCEDETVVVYRGEEAYNLPYLNLRESESVQVEHDGQVWGGYEPEDRRWCYYDEPRPVVRHIEKEPEPEYEEEDQEITEHESTYEDYVQTSSLALFLIGLVLGLGIMYAMLFLLGPYIILVP